MIPRSSGLLLHPTSLPQGRLGDDARGFAGFLADAGQRWWQTRPVSPPGPGRSPYGGPSAFAGSPALLEPGRRPDLDELPAFRRAQRAWLSEWCLYRALRERYPGRPWQGWPAPLRRRDPDALQRAREDLAPRLAFHERRQLAFEQQWRRFKAHANAQGVRLIGDLPIFVATESADVWAHPELFLLDRSGRPRVVTGVPPDYFSRTGQRWNNPHYDWEEHRRTRFSWWVARLRRQLELFDLVRIDHFLGFLRGWHIPARAKTAMHGRWAPGPKAALLRAVARTLGTDRLVAEDLGLVTAEATDLREEFGLPGMRVLQFSFGPDPRDRPFAFPRRCVVYTGTHDNDTTRGWARAGGPDVARACRYADCTPGRLPWGLLRVAQLSPADLAIAPVQDVLGLGSAARMNRPGKSTGNWRWRLRPGALTGKHARDLARLAEIGGR